MEAAVLERPKIRPRLVEPRVVKKPRLDTLEKFLRWKPEDGYKYEWNNGQIEKSPKMITFKNLYIVERLDDLFQALKPNLSKKGKLFTEPEALTSPNQLRIPDMAYYNAKQIAAGARGENPTPPEFVIEFVSDNDPQPRVLAKVEEYFNAGVKIVWLILPQVRTVYVYHSPDDVTSCRGNRLCSADIVVPGFKISAEELFA